MKWWEQLQPFRLTLFRWKFAWTGYTKQMAIPKYTSTSFYEMMRPHAERAGQLLGGVPWDAIATQAAVESNYGNSQLSWADNNYFGLTAGSWLDTHGNPKQGKLCVNYPTHEYSDESPGHWSEPGKFFQTPGDLQEVHPAENGGSLLVVRRWFRKFETIDECMDNYVYVLSLDGYKQGLEAARAGDVQGFFQGLRNGGFATDKKYALTLARRYMDHKSQEGTA